MKVKDLIERLKKLNPDMDVFGYTEDERLVPNNDSFLLFEIMAVGSSKAEMTRLDDGRPYLKFKNDGKEIATLDITTDF